MFPSLGLLRWYHTLMSQWKDSMPGPCSLLKIHYWDIMVVLHCPIPLAGVQPRPLKPMHSGLVMGISMCVK